MLGTVANLSPILLVLPVSILCAFTFYALSNAEAHPPQQARGSRHAQD